MSDDERYVVYALSAMALILVLGTIAFAWLEGWSLLE